MQKIFKKQSNCVYHCLYHIFFGTKYRRRVLKPGIFAYMRATLKELPKYYPELEILEINHEEDHIHILLWIPPKIPVGKVVGILKANTARRLKKKFPFLKEVYHGTDAVWSDGYFVSTVGVNEEVIKRYIEKQGQEDAGQAQLVLVR